MPDQADVQMYRTSQPPPWAIHGTCAEHFAERLAIHVADQECLCTRFFDHALIYINVCELQQAQAIAAWPVAHPAFCGPPTQQGSQVPPGQSDLDHPASPSWWSFPSGGHSDRRSISTCKNRGPLARPPRSLVPSPYVSLPAASSRPSLRVQGVAPNW